MNETETKDKVKESNDSVRESDDNAKESSSTTVTELSEKEKYEATIKDLTETLLRLQAEFENYKKRVESSRKDMIAEASRNILTELMPVLDNFELALKHADNTSKEDLMMGFKLIHDTVVKVMKDNGLEEINPIGSKFSPYEHEAVACEECKGKESHSVIDVVQKGYKINSKVMRHAKVKIAK